MKTIEDVTLVRDDKSYGIFFKESPCAIYSPFKEGYKLILYNYMDSLLLERRLSYVDINSFFDKLQETYVFQRSYKFDLIEFDSEEEIGKYLMGLEMSK